MKAIGTAPRAWGILWGETWGLGLMSVILVVYLLGLVHPPLYHYTAPNSSTEGVCAFSIEAYYWSPFTYKDTAT